MLIYGLCLCWRLGFQWPITVVGWLVWVNNFTSHIRLYKNSFSEWCWGTATLPLKAEPKQWLNACHQCFSEPSPSYCVRRWLFHVVSCSGSREGRKVCLCCSVLCFPHGINCKTLLAVRLCKLLRWWRKQVVPCTQSGCIEGSHL